MPMLEVIFSCQPITMTPVAQPPGSKSIAQILADARSRLDRVSPQLAQEANRVRGALLIDIRPEAQRRHFGEIPGALIIERNVLEWRLDPQSDAHLKDVPGVGTYEVEPIVFCQEGYTSYRHGGWIQGLEGSRSSHNWGQCVDLIDHIAKRLPNIAARARAN
ncbi:hypothetical protein OPQ81_007189 [Rhizoctonia solani]|nr:hypothetical protein OPQ81_007189 [Rhizoctonia solani]